MPETGPDGRKTDYFGTFLSALSRGVTELGVALAPGEADLRDAMIRSLATHDGALTVAELLAPPFTSVGALFAVVRDLQTLGLAQVEAGTIRLTAEGKTVADKLRQGSSGALPPTSNL